MEVNGGGGVGQVGEKGGELYKLRLCMCVLGEGRTGGIERAVSNPT